MDRDEVPRRDASPAAFPAAPDDGMDLRDFFDALARRWKTILLATATTTGLGLAYLGTAATTYTSTVSILIDSRPRPPVGGDPAANANAQADSLLVESQVKLFSSDTVLRRVAQRLGLADESDASASRPGLRDRLMALLGFGAKPSAAGGEDRVSRAVTALAKSVLAKRSEKTYVIDVDVTADNPAKAARLANAIADAYLADQIESHAADIRRDAKFLDQRIVELQSRVQDAENRAQEYRVKHGLTDANGKSVGDQQLSDLATELSKAGERATEAKTRWDRVRELAASGRVDQIAADVSRSATLDKLRAQYADISRQEANLRATLGDLHPAMRQIESQMSDTKRQIADELKRLAAAAAADYQLAHAAELETQRKLDAARRGADARNQSSVELRELERDIDASKTVYEKYLRSRESLEVDAGDGVSARVIAPALAPTSASSPKTIVILFSSIIGGLSIGVGVALFSAYLESGAPRRDRPREDTDDEDDEPGERTPVIVAAPRIGAAPRGIASLRDWMTRTRADEARDAMPAAPLDEVENRPKSPFSKAIAHLYRALAANPKSAGRGARVVLIASMTDEAGKTTIAVNLARHAAQSGRKTLLIDANPDSPGLAGLVSPGAAAGLIDLRGKVRPVYRVGPSLWVVPIMASEDRVAARLSRRPDIERRDGIAGEFDFIVFDGPTIELDGGARRLAGAVDRVVIVASERDDLPLAEDVIDILDLPDGKLAGAVVSACAA